MLTVSAYPECLLLSRVFSKLSPIIHHLMGGVLVSGISTGSVAIIVTSRGLHRLRRLYSEVYLVRGNGLLLRHRVSRVGLKLHGIRITFARIPSGSFFRRVGIVGL